MDENELQEKINEITKGREYANTRYLLMLHGFILSDDFTLEELKKTVEILEEAKNDKDNIQT